MYDTIRTSKQICPHCHLEIEIPIEIGGKKCILEEYTCRHCCKKFTLPEAAKHDICKRSWQICPHCYSETEVLIDVGDEESVLGKFKCRHCKKKFTLIEAAKAKVSKNTSYYPEVDRTSPFVNPNLPPNSPEAKEYSLKTAIIYISTAVIFYLAEKFAMNGALSTYSKNACEFLSNLFLKIIMGTDINTSPFQAFLRVCIIVIVPMALLYLAVQLFKHNKKIVIKLKK